MAFHFFSRRSFNQSQNKFKANVSTKTRFVTTTSATAPVGKDQIVDDRDQWVASVMADAGGGDILCYVHGFNTDQADMLKRMDVMSRGLRAQGFTGVVIGFDWPSQGSPTPLAFVTDRTNGKKVSPYLVVDGLEPFLNHPANPKVHVIAHSMGALVTIRGFARTGDGAGGQAPWKVDQVMLVAAATPSAEMAEGTGDSRTLRDRSERYTNYYSNQDKVLSLAGNFPVTGGVQLGFRGIGDTANPSHVDVYCGQQFLDKFPGQENDAILSHAWYFGEPGFIKDVTLTMKGTSKAAMIGKTRAPVQDSTDQALKA